MRNVILAGLLVVLVTGVVARSLAQPAPAQPAKPATPAPATKPATPAPATKPATPAPATKPAAPATKPVTPTTPAATPKPAPATTTQPAAATQPAAQAAASLRATAQDEEAVYTVIDKFEKAFNAHDAKAIAALYLPDAEIVDEEGNVYLGRAEIEAVFAALFEDSPECKMETSIESLRFVAGNLALEDGTAIVVHVPDEPAERTRYTVVHSKQGGQWMMASARDLPDELATSDEQLKQLAWLIGDWIDESPNAVVHTSYRWSDNESFILGEFEVKVGGRPSMSGSNRIGWDPLAKKIRSWVFDSEGGFGEGVWTRVDNQWVVKFSAVTRDGKVASATNVYTQLSKDRATFQSRDRVRGDEMIDDIEEIILVREPPKPQ